MAASSAANAAASAGRAAGSFAMPRAISARSGSSTRSVGTAAAACCDISWPIPPENGVVPVRHSKKTAVAA